MVFRGIKSGLSLYIWLMFFTVFITFASIVLFNYVSSDLKVARKIYQNSRLYDDIKSILLSIAELYKERDLVNSQISIRRGNYSFRNRHVNYEFDYQIVPINNTFVLIALYRPSNRLFARGIVKIREPIENVAFLTPQNQTFNNSESFYSNAKFFSSSLQINTNRKIFTKITVTSNTSINGKTFNSNPSGFSNEVKKYAELVGIDDNLTVLIRYYNDLKDQLRSKIVRNLDSYPQEIRNGILLTPYRGILVPSFFNSIITIKLTIENGNQVMKFYDNNNNLLAEYRLIVNGLYSINLMENDRIITNDTSIINSVSSGNSVISIVPIAKVMRIPRNGNNYYIIYTNSDTTTFVYSDNNLLIDSDSDLIKVSAKIIFILENTRSVTINKNILYSCFLNTNEFIQKMMGNEEIVITNNDLINNGLLQIVADEIKFNIPGDMKVLNGIFVSLYNGDSRIVLENTNSNTELYLFGSAQFARRSGFDNIRSERYKMDNRLYSINPNLSIINDMFERNIYVNMLQVFAIEIFR